MMSDQQGKLKQLLRDNPQLGILVAEILGPPLGLRTTREPGEPKEGT
jgi:hypothetical protein